MGGCLWFGGLVVVCYRVPQLLKKETKKRTAPQGDSRHDPPPRVPRYGNADGLSCVAPGSQSPVGKSAQEGQTEVTVKTKVVGQGTRLRIKAATGIWKVCNEICGWIWVLKRKIEGGTLEPTVPNAGNLGEKKAHQEEKKKDFKGGGAYKREKGN